MVRSIIGSYSHQTYSLYEDSLKLLRSIEVCRKDDFAAKEDPSVKNVLDASLTAIAGENKVTII